MKIQFTFSAKEMKAIAKLSNLYADKLGEPRRNIFVHGDFDMVDGKPKGVFTRECREEDTLDVCEILDTLSDKIVGIINAAKSLFFLFRDFNEDFVKKLSEIKERRRKA